MFYSLRKIWYQIPENKFRLLNVIPITKYTYLKNVNYLYYVKYTCYSFYKISEMLTHKSKNYIGGSTQPHYDGLLQQSILYTYVLVIRNSYKYKLRTYAHAFIIFDPPTQKIISQTPE